MLQLVLGRASSGKTTYVRQIIADAANRNIGAILIVPEQFSFESEKAIVEMLGAKKAAGVKILSFSSLAKSILDEYDPGRKPSVNDAAKAVIMSIALESLSEKLDIYNGLAKSKKSVNDIIEMTDELIRCDISASEFIAAAERSGNDILVKKASEISMAAEVYESLLTERFSDNRYMLNRAAEIIAEKKPFTDTLVVFDEFTGFTPQENLIVSEILKQAHMVYVAQCADAVADKTGGTGVFSYAIKNIRKLITLCNKIGVPVKEPIYLKNDKFSRSGSLAAVESELYRPSVKVYPDDSDDIAVVAARNPYEECNFVAMTAKKLVRERNYRYRDIVVVGRDASYRKHLTFAFKKYGIPVFEDTRNSLENEITVKYILSALSLAAEGFSADTVMQFLKTYLFGMSAEDISELERYIIIWQIDRGGWQNEWNRHPDGYGNEFSEESEERLKHINELRLSVVDAVFRLKNALKDATGAECTKAVYDFLIDTQADKHLLESAKKLSNNLAVRCDKSWEELMNMLSLLAETIGDRQISPARYLELFKIMVSASDIGDIPTGLDQITIGDADRIRVSDKKVLFAVGANEGIFPASVSQSFVLTENERHILKSQGLELSEDGVERMQKERLRVYSCLSIPSDMLFVSYSMGDFKGSSTSPSEIVTMVKRIVPGCKKIEVALLPPEYFVESNRSAFESAAMHFSDNTVYSRSVKKVVEADDEYGSGIKSIERLCSKEPLRIENSDTATSLFGKNMYLTPSRVEKYYKCPFQYFCRYGLYAKPIEKAVFDSRQNGLAVHFVLEKMFAEFGSDGIAAMGDRETRSAVAKYIDLYIDTYMGGKDNMTQRQIYSMNRCRNIIFEILLRLKNEFSTGKFKTRDVELNIGNDGAVPSYIIDVPDGGKVYLSGIVDRVDTMESDDNTYLRVVDYKTGGKDFRLEDVISGLNLQMLVYLICLFENGKDRYGNVLPAGILYVPAKKGANDLGRDADEDEIRNKRIALGKMNGIVLADKDVILGMEENGGGLIINASINKSGVIKGKTFDMHQFRLLHKAVDDIAAKMAEELHNGSIEVMPMLDGVYKTTCEHCDYKSVCCREDDDECASLFKGDIWDVLEERYDGMD